MIEQGDGIYTCDECAAPLDMESECSNPDCWVHPSHGGYMAKILKEFEKSLKIPPLQDR